MGDYKGEVEIHELASKQNVMTPLNWITGILGSIFSLGLIADTELWIKIFCSVLIVCLAFFLCAVYIYWMLKDPDRLQSEQYQTTKILMQTLSNQGDDTHIKYTKNRLKITKNIRS